MRHYAGEVTYLSHGFREKNKDTLHPDLSTLMRTSSSALVPPSQGSTFHPAPSMPSMTQGGRVCVRRVGFHAPAHAVDHV